MAEFLTTLKDSLGQYEGLKTIEAKTKIPKEQICLGLVAFVFVVVFLGFGMPLVCNLVCFVPPAAISLTAFLDKSVSSAEQQFLKANWMTYWVIFGLFTALETFRAAILYVFPYYYAFKVAVLVWCMSPTWRGAAFIYDHGLKDLVTNKQPLPPPPPPSSSSAKAAKKE